MVRKVASRTQLIQIHEKLKESLICVNEDAKLFQFRDGITDHSIGEAIGASGNAVKLARVELFGKLRHAVNPETLEMRTISEDLKDLTERFNKLILDLSLNKIANVKHLLKSK